MTRAPAVCAVPGCPNLAIRSGRGRCLDHFRESRRLLDRRRPGARARGYDELWETCRRSYLLAHPFCHDCGTAAVDIHHVDGQGPTGPRGLDWTNLRGYCHACHSRRTAMERPAGWATR